MHPRSLPANASNDGYAETFHKLNKKRKNSIKKIKWETEL